MKNNKKRGPDKSATLFLLDITEIYLDGVVSLF